jgi:hypothetical protein
MPYTTNLVYWVKYYFLSAQDKTRLHEYYDQHETLEEIATFISLVITTRLYCTNRAHLVACNEIIMLANAAICHIYLTANLVPNASCLADYMGATIYLRGYNPHILANSDIFDILLYLPLIRNQPGHFGYFGQPSQVDTNIYSLLNLYKICCMSDDEIKQKIKTFTKSAGTMVYIRQAFAYGLNKIEL